MRSLSHGSDFFYTHFLTDGERRTNLEGESDLGWNELSVGSACSALLVQMQPRETTQICAYNWEGGMWICASIWLRYCAQRAENTNNNGTTCLRSQLTEVRFSFGSQSPPKRALKTSLIKILSGELNPEDFLLNTAPELTPTQFSVPVCPGL